MHTLKIQMVKQTANSIDGEEERKLRKSGDYTISIDEVHSGACWNFDAIQWNSHVDTFFLINFTTRTSFPNEMYF